LAARKKKTEIIEAEKPVKVIRAFKAFDRNMQCLGYQFEVGKTYHHEGEVKACKAGFHSCEYPLDVFNYYAPADSVFAEVEAFGEISKRVDNTMFASESLTVKSEIGLHGLIQAAIEYTISRAKQGGNGVDSNSGFSGVSSNSGERGMASNSGFSGAASNSGDSGVASNSGDSGVASNSGDSGVASNSGFKGVASNSGFSGVSSNSGERGMASNSGFKGVASNSGNSGAALNSGGRGSALNSGGDGTASNSGFRGSASNTGDSGVAADFNGYYTKVKSCESGAIVCINRDEDGNIRHIRASKVGDNGIKPDTWYALYDNGEFVEVMK
jgi:hypothetical protein